MKKVLNLTYASSLTELCEVNSSFDTGVLRVAYTGKNRNGSYISKEAFERSIRTMYNCPIVCHYDRETDSLGGHDVEVVRDQDGNYKLVNLTVPVGVIPESAKYWWDMVTEDDGAVHEYLYAQVLLWKRQEAYEKIKRDGVTSHSMEISVKSGKMVDGLFQIDDFEFTAFALIGVTPCFESASLELFSEEEKLEFKSQLSEMMQELKESFSLVGTTNVDNDIAPENSQEGGKSKLDEKFELEDQTQTETEAIETEEQVCEDQQENFEANAESNEAPEVEPETEESSNETDGQEFALTSNLLEELRRVLCEEVVTHEWGDSPRYWYVDCDFDAQEVYCWDSADWLLYGFAYTTDGDAISIDFDSKKRMKYVIEEFDGGEQTSAMGGVMFDLLGQVYQSVSEVLDQYQAAQESMQSMETELTELRKFKADSEETNEIQIRESVFEKFADLADNVDFMNLREHCRDYDLETLEEKCYAIRGKTIIPAKFSAENKSPKLKVDNEPSKSSDPNEPYGDLFLEYGRN